MSQIINGFRVFTVQEYQTCNDIKEREVFMVYEKDFQNPDEYKMMVFDGGEDHCIESNQTQLDSNNLSVIDFMDIASNELLNRMSL